MTGRTIVVVGGTAGIGLELCRRLVGQGDQVVLTGRDADRAAEVAGTLGPAARGIALELADPASLSDRLADVERVDGLVLSAVDRDANSVKDYDMERALRLVTLKLVGYTEVVHALLPRMTPAASTGIVLFGGRAKDRPYPGSVTVSTVNGGIEGLARAMAKELAPIRVNALHPGIVGDSPFWAGKPEGVLDGYRARTPSGALPTMGDIVDGVEFLLRNQSVNAASLVIDCGWEVT